MTVHEHELWLIDVDYVDPVDLVAYEQARRDWQTERADRRREAEEDARADRKAER